MVPMDCITDTDDFIYEAPPASLPERELVALLTALTRHEVLAVIE